MFVGEFTAAEMSEMAIQAATPISCFVKPLSESSALVEFFAPNGKTEGFCGHGFISVARHLKEIGLSSITSFTAGNGTKIKAKVLKSGISSLKIPATNFEIESFESEEIKKLFSLSGEVLEIFKAGRLGDVLVELNSPESLQSLGYNTEKVKSFLRNNNLRAIMFFCKGSLFKAATVEIRVFYINLETLEDVCCGSVNISVAQILYNKYGILEYNTVQPYKFKEDGKIGGYQEIRYFPKKQILFLNGYTEATPTNIIVLKDYIKSKQSSQERFIFEPLDVKFDKNLNPISKNEDYYFLREIFTDPEVMKTSTAFAGGLAENDHDLHVFMNALLEKEESFKKDYGFQKIWHIELQNYIGVAGLIRCKDLNMVEYGMFIKSQYNNRGFGVYLLKTYFEKEMEKTIISSVWIKNYPCIKIVERYGMSLVNKISKIYKNRIVDINVYAKYLNNSFQASNIENALITKQSA